MALSTLFKLPKIEQSIQPPYVVMFFMQLGENQVTDKKSSSILIYFWSYTGMYKQRNGELIKSEF